MMDLLGELRMNLLMSPTRGWSTFTVGLGLMVSMGVARDADLMVRSVLRAALLLLS